MLYDWRKQLVLQSCLRSGFTSPPLTLQTCESHGRRLADSELSGALLCPAVNERDIPTLDLPGLIWGGAFNPHYGHFLLETLSRLWPLVDEERAETNIVFAQTEGRPDAFSLDFAAEIFSALDIHPQNIHFLSAPVRFPKIRVPVPAAELNHYVLPEFRRLCSVIAERIGASSAPKRNAPAYLSKSRLTSGVARFANEYAFVERLQERGVVIHHPQDLSFLEQVSIWHAHESVGGFLGSATHTAVFAGPGSSVFINHEPQVVSNQVLIDRVSGREACYVYPENDLIALPPNKGFQIDYDLADPKKTADEFLMALDRTRLRHGRISDRQSSHASGSTTFYDEPMSRNVALGKVATQSSVFPPHSNGVDVISDASRAVSGNFDERYAFHTALEDFAWWMVDLGTTFSIDEVRIYNRTDIGREHMRGFRIDLSGDGVFWEELYKRDPATNICGDDIPFRVQAEKNVAARYVRITLEVRGYLHLRQVEVYGVETPNEE